MSVRARLQRVNVNLTDPETIADLARDAFAEGEEQLAAPIVLAAATRREDPRLWQWAGLLHRALDEHSTAIECLTIAARVAPEDAKIAQAQAHVSLEAGLDAEALFERARGLAPDNSAVLIGLTAARIAAGHGNRAIAELDDILDAVPLWIEGHSQLAQLHSLLGRASSASASLERAMSKFPGERSLWLARCDLSLRSEAHEELQELVGRAEAAGATGAEFDCYGAIAAGELSDPHADSLLSEDAAAANPALAVWRIRHLLRQDRVLEVLPLIDRELRSERRQAVWPYAAVAWRLAGDPRSAWLEDRPSLVSVIDIGVDLTPMAPLAGCLRALHERSGQFLDQSVRGGSQTDGPLFCRIEPEVRSLRAVVASAVAQYVANLPAPDYEHPLLGPPRNRRIRFSGSWSVRLQGRGHHANHVHPLGWISSALYISVPERQAGDAGDSGWLILGEPDESLGVAAPAHTKIEPKEGKLVLFPSWMWHGTRPFAEGERMTVAFDVAPPR